jgi:CDP-diacylglycerol--serine O-phosphatidyltransferase
MVGFIFTFVASFLLNIEIMAANKIVGAIPNTITSFNALSGSLSVVFALEGNLVAAGVLIFVAALLDFFDGMSARLLKAYSPMGKELDSLADVISFGLAPATIAHVLVRKAYMPYVDLEYASWAQLLVVFLPFVITIFSALRLAKFNIDTRQTDSFIGLATPANALVWASFPLILFYQPSSFLAQGMVNPYILLSLSVLMSLLLVSELPMFSLKFKNLSWAANKTQYIFMGVNIILLLIFKLAGIPLIIVWYILLSVFVWLAKRG